MTVRVHPDLCRCPSSKTLCSCACSCDSSNIGSYLTGTPPRLNDSITAGMTILLPVQPQGSTPARELRLCSLCKTLGLQGRVGECDREPERRHEWLAQSHNRLQAAAGVGYHLRSVRRLPAVLCCVVLCVCLPQCCSNLRHNWHLCYRDDSQVQLDTKHASGSHLVSAAGHELLRCVQRHVLVWLALFGSAVLWCAPLGWAGLGCSSGVLG